MDAPKFTKRNCPIAAQFVADFREVFGADQVTVTMLKEGNMRYGLQDDEPEVAEEL